VAADAPLDHRTMVLRPEAGGSRPGDVVASVARSLHDGVAQELFLARMSLKELAELLGAGSPERRLADGALERVRTALHDTRELIDGLRSADDATERELAPALRRELIDFSARTGVSVVFSESGSPAALSPQAVAEVVGIVREALANVGKHADAGEVRLRARHRHGWTRLTVKDDGRGFRTMPVDRFEVGLGLGMRTMHERARAIGGRIALRSAAGAGTTLTIDIPPQGALRDAG
jgi:signal transduction histidine kinase